MIGWRGEAEEFLENDVEVGGFEKVFTADDIGDSLKAVVVNDGEVVAGSDVFPDDDGVAEELRLASLFSMNAVVPGDLMANVVEGFGEIESEGVGFAGGDAGFSFVG